MRTNGMKALVICAAVNTAAAAYCSEIGGHTDRRGIREICGKLEAVIGDVSLATTYVSVLARSDGMNLVSEGLKEVLEWTRKYAALYPPKETETYNSETKSYSEEGCRIQIFAYLAFKGDARDLEVVKRFDSGTLGALLERRVAGENVFGYDADKLQTVYLPGKPKTFFPSVANTGPQAVYVREILYRYWEENDRDASKIPQELLAMVVSFDADRNPVCSVDLAKYGLSMPVFTPKPNWDMFTIYGEGGVFRGPPAKLAVKFPDLAEPVEITLGENREAPDWKGLYKGMKKAPPPEQQ